MEIKNDTVLSELVNYQNELEGILARFRHTPNNISILPKDSPRLEQIVRELNDLMKDSLGENNNYPILTTYRNGLDNFERSPSLDSVQKIIGIVKAAITRIKRKPDLIRHSSSELTAKPLMYPERMTLGWIKDNVPLKFWAIFGGLLLSAFSLGCLAMTKISILQEWFGIEVISK